MILDETQLATMKQEAYDAGFDAGRAEAWDVGRQHGLVAGRQAAAAEGSAREQASSDRLVAAIRDLETVRTVPEMLDRLLSWATREARRAAILMVRGEELHGWAFAGFGARSDNPTEFRQAVLGAGVVEEAIRTLATASTFGSVRFPAPAFAELRLGRKAIAVPVVLRGEVIAVVYADQGSLAQNDDSPAEGVAWPAAVEIITRHAARCLERNELTASAPRGAAAQSAAREEAFFAGTGAVMARILVAALGLHLLASPVHAQQVTPAVVEDAEVVPAAVGGTPERPTPNPAPAMTLAPTEHPRLPLEVSSLWLAPERDRAGDKASPLARGIAALNKSRDAEALSILSQASAQEGLLGQYALYYAGIAQQRLGQVSDALRTFRLLQQRPLVGYLREAAALGEAEALEAANDHAAAAAAYERLSKERPAALDDILLRLGRELEASGQSERALDAYKRVYEEFPLGDYVGSARARLETFPDFDRNERYRLDFRRAQRLFTAKQYAPARAAFEALKPAAVGDDKEVIALRIAESDFYLKRYRPARDGVAPFTSKGARQGEALYFEAVASRALGDNTTYLRNVRAIVDRFPQQTWAEEALNHLAVQYVRQDDDDAADTVFRELVERYPRGIHTERAVWKVGWRSYRQGRYDETARLFERAAVDFPRSDYRPAWLFWAGRAHEERKQPELAVARYALASQDYLNSYYGRLSVARLNGKIPSPRVIAEGPATAAPPSNAPIVRALLEQELYDDARNELRFIQRQSGDSPAIQATVAWISRQQGLSASGWEQFTLLRGSINTMRRAYPQFMAAGGEYLPRDVLSHIFPLSYWDLIQKYAAANALDPYLVAALVAQESTFVPDVRSSANAVGLMQLMPATARMYARKLGLPFSAKLMTNPEANIRMGTAYLADKVREFGDLHLVLASYNAGEKPVRRWLSERPGVPTDEFIDDIPYPETQNYVKRILGTADDYRRLYGGGGPPTLRLSNAGSGVDASLAVFTGDEPNERLVDATAVDLVTASTPVKPQVVKSPPARSKVTRKPARPRRVAKPAVTKTRATAGSGRSTRPATSSARPVKKKSPRG